MAKKDKLNNKEKYKTYQDIEYERSYELEKAKKVELKLQEKKEFESLLKQKTQLQKAIVDYETVLKSFKQKNVAKEEIIKYQNESKRVINAYKLELKNAQISYNEKFNKPIHKFKGWFYGVGKEVSRTSWASKKSIIISFIVVIVIVIILAAIFFGIDAAFSNLSAK